MATAPQQESVQCVECGEYIDPFRGFICKSCRRRPLCQGHRDPYMKGMCQKCANRLRRKKLQDLQSGVRSMKGFLRFIQFIFLVSAILFTGQRLMPDMIPSYIADNVVFRYVYIPGVLAAVGFVIVYFLYLGQKKSLTELESEISSPLRATSRMR